MQQPMYCILFILFCYRIGLNAFKNAERSESTERIMNYIGKVG